MEKMLAPNSKQALHISVDIPGNSMTGIQIIGYDLDFYDMKIEGVVKIPFSDFCRGMWKVEIFLFNTTTYS